VPYLIESIAMSVGLLAVLDPRAWRFYGRTRRGTYLLPFDLGALGRTKFLAFVLR